jgi:SAM-dependent methyltransferase
MPRIEWNERYATDDLPWDTGDPDEHLVAFVTAARVAPGPALDVGCGTGTNALWLASRGFDALGVDVSARAIDQAHAKLAAAGPGVRCRFEVHDFLADPPRGTFSLVFDRGCFHVFDEAEDRARFAARVAELLAPDGVWLSLIGSTEGPPRDAGPPRRSVRDIAAAIEPALAISELVEVGFTTRSPVPSAAWRCVARRRSVPAQPSTRR